MALAEGFVLDVVLEGDDAVDELHPPAARANTTIAGIHRAARRFRYVGGTPIASPCVGQRWRRYRRRLCCVEGSSGAGVAAPVGSAAQTTSASSSNAAASVSPGRASTPSSQCPRRRFWMKAWPRITTLAVRSRLRPRIGRSLALRRPCSASTRLLAYWVVQCSRQAVSNDSDRGVGPVGGDLSRHCCIEPRHPTLGIRWTENPALQCIVTDFPHLRRPFYVPHPSARSTRRISSSSSSISS